MTKQLLGAIETLTAAVPPWRTTLGELADLTTGAMRFHGVEGSSGHYWDAVAADLELPRLEAARLALLEALGEPLDRLPGPA